MIADLELHKATSDSLEPEASPVGRLIGTKSMATLAKEILPIMLRKLYN